MEGATKPLPLNKHAMKTLKIVQDSCGSNPREWDNLGTMAYKHSNYELGDEEIDDPIEWLEDMLNKERAYEYTSERLEKLEGEFYEKFIALPLYLYDHSGITINTTGFSCRWDSGKVGYIYMTKERFRSECARPMPLKEGQINPKLNPIKRITAKDLERAYEYLRGEVKTFDQYIRGDVYGFQIEDEDGNEIDSCYGFYGDDWENNGIKEHIDEELHPQLETVEIEY